MKRSNEFLKQKDQYIKGGKLSDMGFSEEE
jgi:hypothetical protein